MLKLQAYHRFVEQPLLFSNLPLLYPNILFFFLQHHWEVICHFHHLSVTIPKPWFFLRCLNHVFPEYVLFYNYQDISLTYKKKKTLNQINNPQTNNNNKKKTFIYKGKYFAFFFLLLISCHGISFEYYLEHSNQWFAVWKSCEVFFFFKHSCFCTNRQQDLLKMSNKSS